MKDPEPFDAFYKDARDRLLVQTYCLTGDLNASRRAVRDAFIVASHRWRKVSHLESPEAMVRPHAWRLAQRRHTARVWHRERDIDPDVRNTLEALGRLSVTQRKAVVLTQLAAVSMPQMAREVGLPLEVAERELQTGVAQLSLLREVPAAWLPALFEPVAAGAIGRASWPRATIVRRAGAARRRTHTAVGVLAAVAAVLTSGSLVTDASGVRPTLARGGDHSAWHDQATPPPPAEALPEDSLVTADQIGRRVPSYTWRLHHTDTDPSDNGVVMPCQARPFADRRDEAALVRTFVAGSKKKQDGVTAVQQTELSGREPAARRTYDTTVRWFAQCTDARVQLLRTRAPMGVGDESVQILLRSWAKPVASYIVGIARSGLFTTTTFEQTPGTTLPNPPNAAGLLSDAVDGLCGLDGAGRCAPLKPDPPSLKDVPPVPVGGEPALLSGVDLPPLGDVNDPWIGTHPVAPKTAATVTPCAPETYTGDFAGTDFSRASTRSFLLTENPMPELFGLTETVAALPRPDAARFLAEARDRIARCPKRELGTDVRKVGGSDDGDTGFSVWRLDIRVTLKQSVSYYFAILRAGTAVGQVAFLPYGHPFADGDRAFVGVAQRALERLAQLPAPSR